MKWHPRKGAGRSPVSLAVIASVAAEFVPVHAALLSGGHELLPASRLFRCRDGSYTGRFIYQSAASIRTIFVVRGMRFE